METNKVINMNTIKTAQRVGSTTLIFSMSSGNIRNANGVFEGTIERTKEQKKLSNVAKRVSKARRESMKPGPCVVITTQK